MERPVIVSKHPFDDMQNKWLLVCLFYKLALDLNRQKELTYSFHGRRWRPNHPDSKKVTAAAKAV
jgi:hypothetical protein